LPAVCPTVSTRTVWQRPTAAWRRAAAAAAAAARSRTAVAQMAGGSAAAPSSNTCWSCLRRGLAAPRPLHGLLAAPPGSLSAAQRAGSARRQCGSACRLPGGPALLVPADAARAGVLQCCRLGGRLASNYLALATPTQLAAHCRSRSHLPATVPSLVRPLQHEAAQTALHHSPCRRHVCGVDGLLLQAHRPVLGVWRSRRRPCRRCGCAVSRLTWWAAAVMGPSEPGILSRRSRHCLRPGRDSREQRMSCLRCNNFHLQNELTGCFGQGLLISAEFSSANRSCLLKF
jgi:hypothetical protein